MTNLAAAQPGVSVPSLTLMPDGSVNIPIVRQEAEVSTAMAETAGMSAEICAEPNSQGQEEGALHPDWQEHGVGGQGRGLDQEELLVWHLREPQHPL